MLARIHDYFCNYTKLTSDRANIISRYCECDNNFTCNFCTALSNATIEKPIKMRTLFTSEIYDVIYYRFACGRFHYLLEDNSGNIAEYAVKMIYCDNIYAIIRHPEQRATYDRLFAVYAIIRELIIADISQIILWQITQ